MVTTSIFLNLLSCIALYSTSERAMLSLDNGNIKWLNNHKSIARLGAIVFGIVSIYLSTMIYGVSSGILFWMFSWSLLLSLLILFMPLRLFKFMRVLLMFIVILFIEIFI